MNSQKRKKERKRYVTRKRRRAVVKRGDEVTIYPSKRERVSEIERVYKTENIKLHRFQESCMNRTRCQIGKRKNASIHKVPLNSLPLA